MADIEKWLQDGKHMPPPMRDFHDAKALFKTMHHRMGKSMAARDIKVPNWIEGQCYVVDFFLFFMARRGYTLQRSRADVPFRDLAADIEEFEAEQTGLLNAMLGSRIPAGKGE